MKYSVGFEKGLKTSYLQLGHFIYSYTEEGPLRTVNLSDDIDFQADDSQGKQNYLK